MLLSSVKQWLHRVSPTSNTIDPELGRHLPALDAVRGLAILVVTLYRFGGGSPGPASAGDHVIPFIDVGARGVDLFFVLSGFLITGILFDAKTTPRYFFNFYARRTVRIFPLYYAVLAVCLIGVPLVLGTVEWLEPAEQNASWLWLYGANVLQSIRGTWCLGWLNHFWSLAVEEHFYLVWPAVIYGLSQRSAMRACEALFITALVARVAWLLAGGNPVAPEVFTLFRMDGLVAGAWLALAARSPGGLTRFVPAARGLFALTTLLLIPLTVVNVRLLTLIDTLWTIECLAFLVIIVTASPATTLGRLAQMPLLHWLGKYSYGMYMFANLLIPLLAGVVTASGLAAQLGNRPLAGQLAYIAIMSGLTALVAWISWHLFEKHWLRLKVWFH